MVKDDRAFADIVAERAGGILNQANKKLAGFMPTGELNRRKWNESKQDIGEVTRLQQRYGEPAVEKWGNENLIRDRMEGGNSLKQGGL